MGQEVQCQECKGVETCCEETRREAIVSQLMQPGKGRPLNLKLTERIPDRVARESVLHTSYPYFSSAGSKEVRLEGGRSYFGQTDQQDVPNGYGEMLEDGAYRLGYFKDGELEGVGRAVSWGDPPYTFVGDFKAGQPTNGILEQNSCKYEGPFVDGKPDGHGKLWTQEGNFFEGTMSEGRMDTGKYIYQLHPKIKTFHGLLSKTLVRQCELQYKDRESFRGTVEGEKLVQGEYIYSNGDRYQGQFADGLRSGLGKYFYSKEDAVYEGEFYCNMKHGAGIMSFSNGDSLSGLW
jgi:hypothetical protein